MNGLKPKPVQLDILDDQTQQQYTAHALRWHDCVRCVIGEQAQKHVFVRGELPCDVLCIGEGPGKTENVTGFPFTGRSGTLLDKWLEPYRESLRFAITNVVACRPTRDGKDRRPTPQEQMNCQPRLNEIINIANPKAVVFLGMAAAETNMELPPKCKKLGLYHPSYVLTYHGGSGGNTDRKMRQKLALFLECML